MSLFRLGLVVLLLIALGVDASKLYAWGVNDYGQLGLNGTYFRSPQLIVPYENLDIVELLASGTYHMAITATGDVYVGGNNWYGGLGLPISTGIYQAYPTKNPALSNCKIYLGKRHGNAVCGNKFYGWGVQNGYVLGITKGNYGNVAASLPYYQLGNNVVNVTAGSRFSIVTLSNGTMLVAGDGRGGVLALGHTEPQPDFVRFDAFDDIPLLKIFPSHAEHVCAISQSFSLYCWGTNTVGQLGVGDTANRTRPTLVSYFEQEHYVVQVSTGLYHTIALTASGRVFVWGLAQNGSLGNGRSDNATYSTPFELTTLANKNIVEVVAGLNFNFVRTSTNQWYSWGAGSGGVLGTKTDLDIGVPTPVPFLTSFNINHILTASTSRSVYGWLDPSAPTSIIGGPVLFDECASPGLVICEANAHCLDTDRSATCTCDNGFTGPADNCVDINECQTSSVCVPGAICTNLIGSYNCTCPPSRPVGDGRSKGTGCKSLPPATTASTGTNSSTGTAAPTSQPTTTSQSSGAEPGNATIATDGTVASTTSASATTNPSTTGTDSSTGTTGASSTGQASTSSSSTVSTSTSGDAQQSATTSRTNLYQTLDGAHDNLKLPNQDTTTADAIITNNNSNKNDGKDVMIGVLIAFIVAIVVVIVVGAVLIISGRRPA